MELDNTELCDRYTSKQCGFEIGYPQGWLVMEVHPKRIHFAPPGTPRELVGRPGVTDIHIMVGEPRQPFDKENFIETAKGPVHKPEGDYQILSRTPFKVKSDDEGVLFEFQFTLGAFSFRSMEGIVVKGNRVYSVEANTLEGNYEQHSPIFKRVIGSLYLL
jgi:hypothetical protein